MIGKWATKLLKATRFSAPNVNEREQSAGAARTASDLWNYHPQGEYFLSRGGERIAPPIHANFVITNKCNLRCEICGSQKHLDKHEIARRHMDFRIVQAVAETIFPFLVMVEVNSQGDPLLHPRINDILNLIAHHSCELVLQTNGTLLTDATIEMLTRQIGQVNLSLDAVGPKFDEVRQGGVWVKAEPGLMRFLAARDPERLQVGVHPTITRRTLGDALNVLDWAAEQGVDRVLFHRYSPILGSFEEPPSQTELDKMCESIALWAARNGDPLHVYFEQSCLNSTEPQWRRKVFSKKHEFAAFYPSPIEPVEAGQPGADQDFACAAPNKTVDIGLDGQLSVCCYAQQSPLGFATSVQAFADAWFGENYHRVRSSLRRDATGPYPVPNCEDCMNVYAPKAAKGRVAVRYDAGIPTAGESLVFPAISDLRIEQIDGDSGHCFFSSLPPGVAAKSFDLWEDDRLLGPGDASLEEIRNAGTGRFLITGRSLYWATSDNSNPRRNLRSYWLRPKDSAKGRSAEAVNSGGGNIQPSPD